MIRVCLVVLREPWFRLSAQGTQKQGPLGSHLYTTISMNARKSCSLLPSSRSSKHPSSPTLIQPCQIIQPKAGRLPKIMSHPSGNSNLNGKHRSCPHLNTSNTCTGNYDRAVAGTGGTSQGQQSLQSDSVAFNLRQEWKEASPTVSAGESTPSSSRQSQDRNGSDWHQPLTCIMDEPVPNIPGLQKALI